VGWLMVGFHTIFTAIGLPAGAGFTWALSIVGLVIVIRIILIPLFVKQTHASRWMQLPTHACHRQSGATQTPSHPRHDEPGASPYPDDAAHVPTCPALLDGWAHRFAHRWTASFAHGSAHHHSRDADTKQRETDGDWLQSRHNADLTEPAGTGPPIVGTRAGLGGILRRGSTSALHSASRCA
jgi:hypothetical protein